MSSNNSVGNYCESLGAYYLYLIGTLLYAASFVTLVMMFSSSGRDSKRVRTSKVTLILFGTLQAILAVRVIYWLDCVFAYPPALVQLLVLLPSLLQDTAIVLLLNTMFKAVQGPDNSGIVWIRACKLGLWVILCFDILGVIILTPLQDDKKPTAAFYFMLSIQLVLLLEYMLAAYAYCDAARRLPRPAQTLLGRKKLLVIVLGGYLVLRFLATALPATDVEKRLKQVNSDGHVVYLLLKYLLTELAPIIAIVLAIYKQTKDAILSIVKKNPKAAEAPQEPEAAVLTQQLKLN